MTIGIRYLVLGVLAAAIAVASLVTIRREVASYLEGLHVTHVAALAAAPYIGMDRPVLLCDWHSGGTYTVVFQDDGAHTVAVYLTGETGNWRARRIVRDRVTELWAE